MTKRLLVVCQGYEAWRSAIYDADTGDMIPDLVLAFEASVNVSADAPVVNLYLDNAGDATPLAEVEEIEFRIVKTRVFNFWQQRVTDAQQAAQLGKGPDDTNDQRGGEG